jgi:hypothetical protein
MKQYKIIIPGSNGNTINFHETDSFPTALSGACAMGGYVQRTSDGKFYQDESLASGQVWADTIEDVIEYEGAVDAMIQAFIDMGDLK